MLKKLMKYDLIWINKIMVVYFIISLILSIITRITILFDDSFIGNTLFLISKGFTISAFASTLINVAIRIWVRFANNIYKDESYLTNTLPVTKNEIYNSKFLSILVSILISLFVIIVCFIIAFLDKNLINYIKEIFNNKDSLFMLFSLIITVVLELIYMIYSGIIGITLGHKSNNNKVFKSIFIGIAVYFAIQVLILLIMYVFSLFNSDVNMLFTNDLIVIPSGRVPSILKLLVSLVNALYILFISIMYFVGKKLLNEGVNVE